MIVFCFISFHCLLACLFFSLFWSLFHVEDFPQLSVIVGCLSALADHRFYCGVPLKRIWDTPTPAPEHS